MLPETICVQTGGNLLSSTLARSYSWVLSSIESNVMIMPIAIHGHRLQSLVIIIIGYTRAKFTFVIRPHEMFFESVDLCFVTHDPVVMHNISARRWTVAITTDWFSGEPAFGDVKILLATRVTKLVEFYNLQSYVVFGNINRASITYNYYRNSWQHYRLLIQRRNRPQGNTPPLRTWELSSFIE